jgi:hypothetical protein
MISENRKLLEYRIVGTCLVDRASIAVVTQYIHVRNLADNDSARVLSWMLAHPECNRMENDQLLLAVKQDTGVKPIVLLRMIKGGVVLLPLLQSCFHLLESCFRAEAARILNQNRDKALIPLGPIEKDIENEGNEVWSIITAAANYCSDAGLDSLADQLSNLLIQMNQKALILKDTQRTGAMVNQLKAISQQDPAQIKPFVHVLKEMVDANR